MGHTSMKETGHMKKLALADLTPNGETLALINLSKSPYPLKVVNLSPLKAQGPKLPLSPFAPRCWPEFPNPRK